MSISREAGFDARKRRAIRQHGRGNNGKIQLQFSQRHWTQPGPWPGVSNGSSYADTGYQASWEATRAQPGARRHPRRLLGGSVTDAIVSATGVCDGLHAAASRRRHDHARPARDRLPRIDPAWNGKAIQSLPKKSPFFEASYSFYRVGQYTDFAGYEAVRQGGVLFCGEHTSIDFQGFMEGGASEGKRAAKELRRLMPGD